MNDSDSQFQKIKSGDKKAFEEFFRSHYQDVVRYCYRFVRDLEVSEEITQEVFLYFWEKRDTIEISSSASSYLFAAAKNRSINYLRLELPKQQAKLDISETDIALLQDDIQENSQALIKKFVNDAINSLPKKCRDIFILSRNAGLTYEEIAEELSLSKKTVENQMGIALKKLRESLRPVLKYLEE